jgi:hypothetical protein
MNKKQFRLLMNLLPIATYLFILLPVILFWKHPSARLVPPNATEAQWQQFRKADEHDNDLLCGVVCSIMVIPMVAVGFMSFKLNKMPDPEDVSEKITIQIDAKWKRIMDSPLYWIVATLTGVSVTFCPLFLYVLGGSNPYFGGTKGFFVGYDIPLAILCFGVIYGVSTFYFSLAAATLTELRKNPPRTIGDR